MTHGSAVPMSGCLTRWADARHRGQHAAARLYTRRRRSRHDAERELTAAGWLVRRIADIHIITADFIGGRANLYYHDDESPQGGIVYATSVG